MNVARSRLWTCVALSLVLGVLAVASADAGLFGLGRSKKKTVKPPKRLVVVFPFDQGSVSKIPEGFGRYIASDVRTMLGGSENYIPFLYKDRLAPILRAKEDNVLKTADMAPPFAEDKVKTLKLAQILATDLYVVGRIEDFQFDRASKVAEMTLTAELYDGRTGKFVKGSTVMGRTPETVTTSDEDELRDLAKGAAVTKLIAELTKPLEPEAKPDAGAPPPAATSGPPAPAGASAADKTPAEPPASAPPPPAAK
jgi:hypothetical protein